MIEVKALRGLEHGGTIKRDQVFPVATQAHVDLLVGKGLVEVVGEVSQPGGNADKGAKQPESAGVALVAQNAADVVTALAQVTDPDLLAAGLEAEKGKGEKARKSVIEALTAAIAAAQPQV
ncbi:hypothetical protein [Stenotrophomonas chelatiphaga]|uniref:hypothetical protein n=1 Tax=Stenotrophomonas chelatiphaga TaxID=517011 RepID=UPI00289C40BD|nr:hypothetical protein [Stenotrophomonas chelatiphaga]